MLSSPNWLRSGRTGSEHPASREPKAPPVEDFVLDTVDESHRYGLFTVSVDVGAEDSDCLNSTESVQEMEVSIT